MIIGAHSPEQVKQATVYIDQLADQLILSIDQSDGVPIQSQRDYLGGIVIYDQLLSGPVSAEHEVIPYDRQNAGQTIAERLNGRYFAHIDSSIGKRVIEMSSRHLPSYITSIRTTHDWRTIARLVGTNIFDANDRNVSEVYDDVDMLRRLAAGQVHVRLWNHGKN